MVNGPAFIKGRATESQIPTSHNSNANMKNIPIDLGNVFPRDQWFMKFILQLADPLNSCLS